MERADWLVVEVWNAVVIVVDGYAGSKWTLAKAGLLREVSRNRDFSKLVGTQRNPVASHIIMQKKLIEEKKRLDWHICSGAMLTAITLNLPDCCTNPVETKL